MGKVLGFLDYHRQDAQKEPVEFRLRHWNEFVEYLSNETLKNQGARCMDCGVPFCHWMCPVCNIIPELNDLVYRGCWKEAFEWLIQTNNFPEFTGRVCPALCENSCVLAITEPAVTIKNIEFAIIEHAYREGWMKPEPPTSRTGKRVAVIGSGPSGLAYADELNKCGHTVIVYEKHPFAGGLLALGIPDFKLEPKYIERRLELMQQEGVVFKTNTHVGIDIGSRQLQRQYDALVLCGGSEQPRDLKVPGRDLQGVHLAWNYLSQQNLRNRGLDIPSEKSIAARGKRVIVLGGGDTGADCVGTANRQGALTVKQFELFSRPPAERLPDNPWPQWARIERTGSSHQEGCIQDYSIMTTRLTGADGQLEQLHAVRLDFGPDNRGDMQVISGTEFTEDVDLVILAMGFIGPRKDGLIEDLGIEPDNRGNVKTDHNNMTNVPGVFAAGDIRRGQSLVVWAIHEGRRAAEGVEKYLEGER